MVLKPRPEEPNGQRRGVYRGRRWRVWMCSCTEVPFLFIGAKELLTSARLWNINGHFWPEWHCCSTFESDRRKGPDRMTSGMVKGGFTFQKTCLMRQPGGCLGVKFLVFLLLNLTTLCSSDSLMSHSDVSESVRTPSTTEQNNGSASGTVNLKKMIINHCTVRLDP